MKPFIIALAIAHAMDATSSCQAFATGSYREGNPLVPTSCPAVIAVSAASSVAVDYAAIALKHRGHPKLAKALLIAVTSVEVESAVHNWRH